jgi:DNA-binding NarL/FixJ family response regulator
MVQSRSTRDVPAKTRSIALGIIEPQRLFAPFLTQVFSEAGFIIVTSVETLALDELSRNEPTVVLIDLDFIEIDPISAIRQIRGVVPNATICAYTAGTEAGWAATCTRAGANCVISKSASPAEIVAGIQRALRVGAYIDRRFNGTDDDKPNDASDAGDDHA